MTLHRILVCLLFIAAAALPCFCQEDSLPPSLSTVVLSDAGAGLDDAAAFWTAPTRFTACNWLTFGAAVGGVAVMVGYDARLQDRFASPRGDERSLWDVPTWYGEIKYAGVLTLGTYTAGLVGHDRELRRTGRLLFESLALSASAMLATRFLLGRSRPSDNRGARDFKGFRWNNAEESFPSGHATVAFAVSTVLAERIDHPVARLALYGLAALTAAARVHDDQHWTSDVLAGAALGLAAGFHVVGREQRREAGRPEDGAFSITPLPGGLLMQYTFR
jgi:membrane-associated phospholipid phosphatase